MSWFRTFFEDDYLRVFGPYVDGERADREAAGVTRLLDLPTGSRVLDLACGQGRHAVPLRRAGLDVLGLDLSQVLLQAARDRDPHLPLLQADMRALPLADDAVDGVVNLFNAFGYFARELDDLGVLREVARVLRPGGASSRRCTTGTPSCATGSPAPRTRPTTTGSWSPRTGSGTACRDGTGSPTC